MPSSPCAVSASGAVYVFVRAGGLWSQQAYLKASNSGNSDNFGVSVAVSGDTAVVGSNSEDGSATGVNGDQSNDDATGSGAAYVFVRSGGVWSQQAYLKASNTGDQDRFGWAVAVSGDSVVVGAWGEDSNALGVDGNGADNSFVDSGAAYVFAGAGPVVCGSDIDGDGSVGGADLGLLLSSWGVNPGSPADLNLDGVVDGADLGAMLAAWGSCP